MDGEEVLIDDVEDPAYLSQERALELSLSQGK
jgi:hypothetical protein